MPRNKHPAFTFRSLAPTLILMFGGATGACGTDTGQGSNEEATDEGEPDDAQPQTNAAPSSSPTASGDDSAPNRDAYDTLLDAICRTMLTCHTPNDDSLFPAAVFEQREGAALDNCRSYFGTSQTREYLGRYIEADERGSLRIDWALLETAMGCELPPTDTPWYQGLLAPGSACQMNLECAGGYCDASQGCPGQCAAGADIGQACEDDQECASGHCEADECVEPTLTTGASEGEACNLFGANVVLCEAALWCNDGTCQPPIGALQTCSSVDDVCATGHFCVPDTSGASRCKRVQVQSLGEPCDSDPTEHDALRVCDMIALDECVAGTCIHREPGGEGAACTRTEVDDTCTSGHWCSWETDTCTRLLADGEACSSSGDCENHCSFNTGICESLYCDSNR